MSVCAQLVNTASWPACDVQKFSLPLISAVLKDRTCVDATTGVHVFEEEGEEEDEEDEEED